jgi:hypothetical protein
VPGPYSGNQRWIWRVSFLINLAITAVVLIAGTVIAVKWGNPLPIHLPTLNLGGKIVFGWLVVVVAFALLFPVYLAVQSRAITTPPRLRQIGLGSVTALSEIRTPQGNRTGVAPELSRMVGVITHDATHWGPVATFDGFPWGFRLRASRLPLPVKRMIPVLSVLWSGIENVEQVDYPSLITILIIRLRDPALSFGLCLASIPSLQVVDYIRDHGVDVRLMDSRLGPGSRLT